MRVFKVFGVAAVLVVVIMGAAGTQGAQVKLPEEVPAPEVHSAPAGNIPPKHLGDTPIPQAKPDEGPGTPVTEPEPKASPALSDKPTDGDGKATDSEAVTPQTAPIPEDSPLEDHDDGPSPAQEGASEPAKPLPEPDPRSGRIVSHLMPPEEVICRQRLRTLGVKFEESPAQSDPAGCSIPYPISVSSLAEKTSLEPAGVMNCAMAEAAAKFTADTINPAAKSDFGADVTSIGQASAYVCRPRAGTRKLSEHAFGNALDIARFNLSNGKAVDVMLKPEETAARFLDAVRAAACGPFKTVLGPGSNADHATHLHLDLAPRRHGGTVCE